MKLRDLWPVRRPFKSEGDIKVFLGANFDDKDLGFLEAETLLIFSSRTQRTWLVATEIALYCVFDIIREDLPRVLWKINRKNLVSEDNNALSVQIRTEHGSDLSGLVIINKQRPRKYSKKLFLQLSIKKSIRIKLRRAFKIAPVKALGDDLDD